MEALAQSQLEVGKAIEKGYANFSKDSVERKTASYATQRLAVLKAQWELFESNDAILQKFKKEEADHSYFANEYFGKIKAIAERFRDALKVLATPTPSVRDTNEGSKASEATKRLQGVAKASRQLLSSIELEGRARPYYRYQSELLRNQKKVLDEANDKLWMEMADYEGSALKDLYEEVNQELGTVIITLQELVEPEERASLHRDTGSPSTVKLPKITLPTFSGRYLQWIQFKELFVQLVHSQELTDTQKMFHLVTSLKDEASTLIQHLPVAANNYQPAWQLLCQRYDNKRLLVSGYLNKFTQQPAIHSESANALKKLHDTTKECLMGLKNLGLAVEHWDAVIVHLLIKKLDKTTHALYEQSLADPKALDNLTNLLAFLEMRFQSLEALHSRPMMFDEKPPRTKVTSLVAAGATPCVMCGEPHPLFSCKVFREKSTNKKTDIVQKHKLCYNCLRSGHSSKTCDRGSCSKCNKRHHTLLHRDIGTKTESKGPTVDNSNNKVSLLGRHTNQRSYVLLGTVVCSIRAANGEEVECRALLDSGSQINGISQRMATKLELKSVNDPTTISGIGCGNNVAQKRAYVQLRSPVTECELEVEAFILNTITIDQPSQHIDITSWDLPGHVRLADPEFHVPGPIDLLIGAEHYFHLIKEGRMDLGQNLPSLQNTSFGWVVSGKATCNHPVTCLLSTREEVDLSNQVQRFWESENLENDPPSFSTVEKECEEIYRKSTKRHNDGRFIVRLPFKHPPTLLGKSRFLALTRLYATERRLERDPELKKAYHSFIDEYIKLGHMSRVSEIPEGGYYLPHHCVVKPDSSTTKVRVVFDASAKSATNVSLNDILHTGPKIQEDLFSVLLRFRMPRFVCSADIEKMYRQIIMHEADRKYQLILWRESTTAPIRTYQLNTVTYGFTSAPFHATQSLHELANEASLSCPQGARAIRRNMYVDDAMFGADNLDEALHTQQQVVNILKSGGFQLRKWCANHPAFTRGLPKDQLAPQLELSPEGENEVNTLGLHWLPASDEFRIKVNSQESKGVTKRNILSDIARLFDPLGLVGPVIVTGKVILKTLWQLNLNWDDDVPYEIEREWLRFRDSLQQLTKVSVQRHISAHKSITSRQLHVFCDASDKAYGAALYVRSQARDGTIIVRLLCAKSKIAPITRLTTPRLELCAAKLGSELAIRVQKDLEWQGQAHFWTDSTIVLAWLRSPVSSLHRFVANRVSAIQEITKGSDWRHVPSAENPADLISRGLLPDRLIDNQLWFCGPIFLHGREETWPRLPNIPDTTIETKLIAVVFTATQGGERLIYQLSHMSSITRIQRTIAYILRFIFNSNSSNNFMKTGSLSVQELEDAMELIIREVQHDEFAQDIQDLQDHRAVNPKGKLAALDPRLDDRGILRVGGRLENANLPYEAKHQAVLPGHHFITKLIMRRTHFENKHVGTDALLAITRQKYWPINGKAVARSTIQKCVICAKHRPKLFEQLMGNLPSDRVQPARPFLKSGVDFCGPFYTRQEIRGRGPLKTYWAIFCCFATKAVHIEVVKNLTTEAFISALKRFTGRRGNCATIYCDNATNFIGANNQLKELEEALFSRKAQETIHDFTTTRSIQFKFIPPRSPHFGGLWEAAVKSAKSLLKKAIGPKTLTHEEFSTIAVEIEAILNSRPLTPLSSDPHDMSVLTPGHFLIGGPVNATVDPSSHIQLKPLPETSKELAAIKGEFWERWHVEYLSQLQERHKWRASKDNVKPGTLVIIKDDNLPVSSWPLGRITRVMPGKDGKVRTVDIWSGGKTITRVIHNLAPLPIETEDDVTKTLEAASQLDQARPSTSHADTAMTRPSKRRKLATSLLTTLIVLSCIFPTRAVTPILGTPITGKPGFYFENLGSVSLIKDEWTMIAYYNTTSFWAEYELIGKGLDNLRRLCNLVVKEAHCCETVDQFTITFAQIGARNEILRPTRRLRRSPLDVIGNIANSLFGVLDSKYAEQMTNIIRDLEANDQHLLELLRNQTSIIDSTQNIITKASEVTQHQLAKVYRALNQTTDALNTINQDLDHLKATEGFNALAIRLILMMSDFQRVQDLLINVLVDTQHGKINPLIISPQQLKNQIQLIKDQLPKHLTLPRLEDDLPQLYQVMKVDGKVAIDFVIFKIVFPLVSIEPMELMSVTPVPSAVDNKILRIVSRTSIMLINVQEERYFPMTSTGFSSSCTNYQVIGYLCRLDRTTLNNAKTDSCELRVFLHKPNLSICEMEYVADGPRWQRLKHANKWLYTIPEETVISIICDGQVSHQPIKGVGTLDIPRKCAIKDGRMVLEASQFGNKATANILPVRNLSELQVQHPNHTIKAISIAQTNLSIELKQLQARIHKIKDNELRLPSLSHHDIHHYTISYSCLALLIAVILIGGITWRRSRKHQPGPPVPRPRTTTQPYEDEFDVATTF